jgi:hypothetical protein
MNRYQALADQVRVIIDLPGDCHAGDAFVALKHLEALASLPRKERRRSGVVMFYLSIALVKIWDSQKEPFKATQNSEARRLVQEEIDKIARPPAFKSTPNFQGSYCTICH